MFGGRTASPLNIRHRFAVRADSSINARKLLEKRQQLLAVAHPIAVEGPSA
jgi:hypothetical protein